MFVVVNSVSVADASAKRYEMDVRDHADQYLVGQPGFRQLKLLHPKSDGDYLLLAYWDSEKAFEQWTETDDFEAAHEELFGAMFLDPEHVDRYESVTTLEAP
ncbi:antibiotic biosynthesis monooxygenase family protein [Haloarcula laminariae]|jgi:heme-degrading monooxygenase HmoA|uniref:antibiotic biosynthesis monooxygenase family protein n=1 Tax=Haloarcula laminariae TaxID=2961577 RepID=UPI00240686F0|nr:antibiotic biosynthesis monooxygenase [Halomicroarcula sp. FL173]